MTGDNHEGMVFIYALAAFLNECNDEGFELVTTIEAMGGRAEQLPDIFALAAERREQEEEVIRLMPFNLSPIARALGGQAIVERALSAIMTGRGIADAVAGLDSLLSTVRLSNLGRRMHVHLLVWYVRLGALDRAFAMAHELLDHYECLGTRGVIWGPLWYRGMDLFRTDQRFAALAKRIGLTAYWQRHGRPDLPVCQTA